MGFVDESIVVALDVADAYSIWLDYEHYPRFMRGVERVEVTGYCRMRWTARVCGDPMSWDVEVVDRLQDTRLRWRACDGRETGDVDFQKLDAGSTLVHYQLEYEPDRWGVGDVALRDCLQMRVRTDLEAFRLLVEARV
jgi:uncharacterized membrane protein